MLLEVMDVIVLVLALPLLIGAIVLTIRGIAQPDKEAADRLYRRSGGLMIAFVLLSTTTSLLRRFLEG
jgi:hypothetical protein